MNSIDYYSEHAEAFYSETIDLDLQEIYASFLSLVPKSANILDAGSGSGRDSRYFLQQGYNVTAFDASYSLVSLSSRSLGDKVHHLSFQQLKFENEFDAIWACASLLHVSRKEIDDVINRLIRSLKPQGIIYASFKYGDKEEIRDGRLFNYYDEDSFEKLLRKHESLSLIKSWKSEDVRESRRGEYWFNALLKKTHP